MPSDWMTVDDATETLIDYRGKTPPKTERGVPLITAKVIKGGRILEEPREYIAADSYDAWMRRGRPRKGDVLLTTEAPLGEVALLRRDDKIALAQRVILLRADASKVDPLYLFYSLQSEVVQAELRSRSSGTTVLGVKQSELRKTRIPVVDLPRQRKIGYVLSVYDDLIENNLRRIRILEVMARALYREWFVNFRFPGYEKVGSVEREAGMIPAGWDVKRLGEVAREVREGVAKGDLACEQPSVGLEHIPRRSLALDSWEVASTVGSNKLRFRRGDVLFGKIRPYFHKVSLAPFEGVCSADTIVIRPNDADNHALITACVSSDAFVAHATATSNGSKMPRADWKVLRNYPVLIPTRTVNSRFAAFFSSAATEQQTLVFENQNLQRARDLLLPRLLSGQIELEGIEPAA